MSKVFKFRSERGVNSPLILFACFQLVEDFFEYEKPEEIIDMSFHKQYWDKLSELRIWFSSNFSLNKSNKLTIPTLNNDSWFDRDYILIHVVAEMIGIPLQNFPVRPNYKDDPEGYRAHYSLTTAFMVDEVKKHQASLGEDLFPKDYASKLIELIQLRMLLWT